MSRLMRPHYVDPQTNMIYDTNDAEFEGWLTKQSVWLKVCFIMLCTTKISIWFVLHVLVSHPNFLCLGLAPPLFHIKRIQIIFFQDGLQRSPWDGWFEPMHDRQIGRSQIEKTKQFWNQHTRNHLFAVRWYRKRKGWLDRVSWKSNCEMFQYVLPGRKWWRW